ncbi:unnamed protein product [Parnassius apollo]|uniref:(apollo) hypothetical protein n=1 Tax=Parnassius apollo TaxID=110799 RepID=A0A8S3WRD3_PARAO|nr:unnamed protein product [Parnassius apollo]
MSGDGDRKSSKAWQFFKDLKNDKAKCNFCQKEFSYKGGGAYNLIRHTKSKHPQVFVAIRECPIEDIASSATEIHNLTTHSTDSTAQELEMPTASTSTASTYVVPETSDFLPVTTKNTNLYKKAPATNTKLTQYFYKPLSAKKTEHLNKMLVKLFTKNYLAFHLIESPELKDFIKELNPAYQLPSCKTLSNALMTNVYNQTKKRHTSENLALELKRITDNWEITDKIVAAISDNAYNIKAAIRLNNWKQIPCFAHTLNLIVQSALKEIKDITTKIKQIVELFRRSPFSSERLKNMQKKLDEPLLKIKQDVSTRWNSTYDMFERVLKIKNSVMSTIAIDYPDTINMTSEDIEVLDSAIEILSFFKDVTEEMSSEKNVTISEVILISNTLKKKCLKFLSTPHPDCILRMTQVLLNEISTRFSCIEENNIFAESTILDPRFKKYGFENEYAYSKACTNIKAMAGRIQIQSTCTSEPPSSSPSRKRKHSIWNEFDEQVDMIIKNINPTAGGIIEVDKYLEEPLLPRSQDPAKWWFVKKDAYPRLYKLFLKRLCIVATSVPSERTFSKAGQVLTERRNRLSGNKVAQILFLHSNL